MLEFNPDGSLRRTSGQVEQDEADKKSLVISREQISEKPARALIKIKFPEPLSNPREVFDFYDKIDDSQFRDVFHELQQIDDRTFIVKVDRGCMMMYSLLNFMMMCFRDKFEGRFPGRKVILKGKWAVFG